jgi:OOP family OmpA-OmpF porin
MKGTPIFCFLPFGGSTVSTSLCIVMILASAGCRASRPPETAHATKAQGPGAEQGGDGSTGSASTEGKPDADGDGIPDDVDQCPDQPEVYNGYQDEDGCGDCVLLVPKEKIQIAARIFFKKDESKIQDAGTQVLDAVAAVLIDHAEMKVKIIGHRDPSEYTGVGGELSDERAKEVLKYLVNKGVDPDRLETEGRGDSQPAPPEQGVDQAELNRRVEFEVLTTGE